MKETIRYTKAYDDVMRTQCKGKITQNLKLIYCLLLSFQESTGNAYPSNQYIADHLGISKRTVIDSTSELEQMGLIEKKRQFNNSNIYTVRPWDLITRGATIAPPSAAAAPPSATVAPPEVQPTAPYKIEDNIIYQIKDKISEAIQEDELINDNSFPCTSSSLNGGGNSAHNQGWSINDIEEPPF